MNIYSAWLQGRKAAPEYVQKVFSLWEDLNPDCKLHVIEADEASEILRSMDVLEQKMTPQITTDLIRARLLAGNGGVWADATLLPTKPLSEWLTNDLRSEGFFAFRSEGDPNLVLQTWFLYAEAGNPLITAWLEKATEYFSQRRHFPTWKRAIWERKFADYLRYKQHHSALDNRWFIAPNEGQNCAFYPYAVMFYCFAQVLEDRPDLATKWANVPSLYSFLPHALGRAAADADTPPDAFHSIAKEILPVSYVHKLNYHDPRFIALPDEVRELLNTKSA